MTISVDQLTQSIAALRSSELPVIAGRTTITYQFLTMGTNGTYRASDYSTGLTPDANVLAIQNLINVGGVIVPVDSVRALTEGDQGERLVIASIFAYLETILNVRFVNVTGTLDANGQPVRSADIRLAAAAFGNTAGGINARKANGAPNYTNDVFLSTAAFNRLNDPPGNAYFRSLAMHEIGHALGLKHSFYEALHAAAGFVPPDFSNTLYSQMAYDESPLGEGKQIFPVTMQMLDIATLQSIYGTPANSAATQGNNTYEFLDSAPPAGVAAVVLNRAYKTQYKTIYDTNGIDTLDASNQTAQVKIDLRQTALSSIGVDAAGTPMDLNIGIASGTEIENAKGGSGNDRLEGNDLENQLWGNAGDDTLDGGTAYNQPWDDGKQDTLRGGTGSDTYILHQGQGNVAGVADKIIDHNTSSERNKILVKDAAGIIIGTLDGGMYFKQEGQEVWVDMNGDTATKNSPVTITDDKLKVSVVFGDEAGDFQDGDFGIQLQNAPTQFATPSGNADDVIDGGTGSDTIYAEDGNDTLDGGETLGEASRLARAEAPVAPAAAPPKSPRSASARARTVSGLTIPTSTDVNTSHSACGIFTFTQIRNADTLLPKARESCKPARLTADDGYPPQMPKLHHAHGRRSALEALLVVPLSKEWLTPTILGDRHEPVAQHRTCANPYPQASSNCRIKRRAGWRKGGASSRIAAMETRPPRCCSCPG